MRNKIKQLLKKEGGFTLVELLGVIVILGLIIGISIPLIGNVINNSKDDIADNQQELVIDALQMYDLNEGGTLEDGDYNSEDLADKGYLESKIDPEITVTKTTTDGKVTYELSEE